MPGPVTRTLGRTAQHVPGLRRIPIVRLLALGEIAMLAHEHYNKLQPHERRRLFDLIRMARGRTSNLSEAQRRELSSLVAKAEPRVFAGTTVNKLSPVSLPNRLLYGGKKGKGKKK